MSGVQGSRGLRFENKVAVVTGGCCGVGRGCVDVLVEEGGRVAVLDFNDEVGNSLNSDGVAGEMYFIHCDMNKEEDIKNAIEEVIKKYGHIDCLVNNVGTHPGSKEIDDLSVQGFRDLLNTNLVSYFTASKYALPYLRKTKGCIVNIGSIGSSAAAKGMPSYCASKATTIHRFTGIADCRHDPKEIGPWILSSPSHSEVLQHIQETDVVIIDECSMISARTLESICEVLSLKDTSVMFGGIQVILCGDFRQLPPVKDNYYGDDGSYCFEADFFNSVFPHRVVLTEVVRQTDRMLINSILEISKGTVSGETVRFMKLFERNVQDTNPDDIHLFARNDIVDDYNRKKILDFPGQLYEYTAIDEGENKSKLDRLTVPKKLWLKIGIPVILLRNMTDRLVNGLRGEIFDIDDDGPTVEFKDAGVTTRMPKYSFEVYSPRLRRNVAVRRQFPIKPAFGLTVHKAQGMTLDRVHIDCRDIFQAGQLGVAISRVKTLEGLSISNFHPRYCIGHPQKVTEFLGKENVNCLDDRSCCRNCRRNEATPLITSDDEVLSVPVDVDLNLEDDGKDESQFDDEFNQVIQELDSDADKLLEFSLPDDFCCETLVNKIKTEHPCTESQHNINQILSELPLLKMEFFCKKEFLAISKIVDELKITEPRSVSSKELGQLCIQLRRHFTGIEYKMNCISLFQHTNEPITEDHLSICLSVHEFVRDFLMKQKTNLYRYENQNIKKRFITSPSKARLRYVSGFCVAKLRHNYAKKKTTHRFSLSADSQRIYEECNNSLTILNLLKEDEEYLKSYTTDEASLSDISRRQNITRSLTNIPDDIFHFFTNLCDTCLSLLKAENLNKYNEEIFTFCYNEILDNKTIKTDFMEKVSAKMTSLQTEVSKKLNENHDLKCQYVYKIYGELVKKFLMVFFAQFRKDVKSSYHVEKTIAHRKQIQLSVSKKKSSLKSKTSTAHSSPNRESVSDNVLTPLSECCSVPSAEVTTATDMSTDVTTTSETGGTTSVEEASTSCAAEASTSYTAEASTSSTSKKPRKKKRQATGRKRKAKGKAAATKTSGSYVGGTIALTKALAIDEAKHGVRVNAVSPSIVDTPLLRTVIRQWGEEQEQIEMLASFTQLGRLSLPREIGKACLFLAVDATFTTGTELMCTGGTEIGYGVKQ